MNETEVMGLDPRSHVKQHPNGYSRLRVSVLPLVTNRETVKGLQYKLGKSFVQTELPVSFREQTQEFLACDFKSHLISDVLSLVAYLQGSTFEL